MRIADTRKCNLMNLGAVARYLGAPEEVLVGYYRELWEDAAFMTAINGRIKDARKKGFQKGIFRKPSVPAIDWFAFERVLIYVLIRHLKPKQVLETGVYYGGNSAFALKALARNKAGHMLSIDYPDAEIRQLGASVERHTLVGDSEFYDTGLRPGFMTPLDLLDRWTLVEGDSLKVIPERSERFDFYIHDSDHSMQFLSRELAAATPKLTPDALILVDDIDWSNAFYAYCVDKRLHPLLLTDNGKDELRVRTGIVKLDHARNRDKAFT
ncbi:MAG TPA: class I SAM-dependent methyltransferase [Caulobacteraceae bacterium]